VTAAVAALAGLLFGYDTGVISGAILYIKDQFALSPAAEEGVVSAVLLGAVLGAAFSGALADYYGRRRILIAMAVLFSIGAIGSSAAAGVGMLILCRILIGIAIGVSSYVAPLYISEISPPDKRGALVSLNQLMITCGIVVSYLVDYMLAGSHRWRWMFALGAVPALILIAGMLALYDSPRWLISKNRIKEARQVLKHIMKQGQVDSEVKRIDESLAIKKTTWKDLLQPWVRPALIVGMGLAFFQQVTGINTIIYYAPTIFQYAGFTSNKAAIFATLGVGVVNVAMTIVAIWLVDRVGRKPLLFVGMTGMTISLAVLGLAFKMSVMSETLKIVAMLSVIVYIASFAIGLGPIFWLMISEIYPLKIRGRAMSIATVTNWGFNMIIAATFLTLINKLGKANTFWLFALLSVGGIAFCYFFVPETKGHSLEKIEQHLRHNKSLRTLGT
ncbi:MAG: sugar porter family MFS transporter, partial [Candidatus Omnitrophica bacterium]|nr:sugar porter family MFS transporter [Candidatus Omnitrophota bacterium]